MNKYLDYLTKIRRQIHRNPEPAYKEFETSKLIKNELNAFNIPYAEIGTGVVAVYNKGAGGAGNKILFRADMDALLLKEDSDAPYKSQNEYMHACGHDGHTALLLTFAYYLSENKINREIILVFQPAEEGKNGASRILKGYNFSGVTECYAAHIDPGLETGKIRSLAGVAMAGSYEFEMSFSGAACHAAEKENGADALRSAVDVLCEIYNIEEEYDDIILHAGTMSGGSAWNIVADRAKFSVILRYFDDNTRDEILNRIKNAADVICKVNKTSYEINFSVNYIKLVNSGKCVERLSKFENFECDKKRYTAEDFAFFLDKFPGALIWLGAKDEKRPRKLHSVDFDFDEKALMTGLELFIKLSVKS